MSYKLLIFFISFTNIVFAQTLVDHTDNCSEIAFGTDTLDIGRVTRNADVIRNITIKNTGNCPLIIYSISGGFPHEFTCSKNYYQPGDSGKLRLIYPTDKEGPISQVLTIYSNARDTLKSMYIKGLVLPENVCGQIAFDKDTMDLGPVPYGAGKHFIINTYNKGKCPMTFRVEQADNYMNVLNFSRYPIRPGDTGKIDIHLGGQLSGYYFGKLKAISLNSIMGIKTIVVKAHFLPPDKKDSGDSEIKLDKEILELGKIVSTNPDSVYFLKGRLKITNTGKRPITIILKPTAKVHINDMPEKPIQPKESVFITPVFTVAGEPDIDNPLIFEPFILNGNFVGKSIIVYAKYTFTKAKQ